MTLIDGLKEYLPCSEASGARVGLHAAHSFTDNNTVGSSTGLVYPLAANFVRANSESLSIADHADFRIDNHDWTSVVWVNPTTLPASVAVTVFSKDNAALWEYDVYVGGGVKTFRFYAENAGGSGFEAEASTYGTVQIGVWQMVLAERDRVAETIGISVNNGATNTVSATGDIRNGGYTLRLGAEGGGAYFDGVFGPKMDWNRLLTVQEKTDLYNAGAGLSYAVLSAVATVGYLTPNKLRPGLFKPGLAR